MLISGLALLWFGGSSMARKLSGMVAQALHFDPGLVSDDKLVLRHLGSLLMQGVSALVPLMVGAVLVAIAAPMLLGGVLFSPSSIKFDLTKLGLIS